MTLKTWIQKSGWLAKDIKTFLATEIDKEECFRKIMGSIRQWSATHTLPIQKGDDVYCLVPINGFLTFGKHYKVDDVRPEEKRIVITDDRGSEGWFAIERFSKL